MKILLLGALLILSACQVFKNKEQKTVKLQQIEIFDLVDKEQVFKREEQTITNKNREEESIEIVAKDVFYWHPDSGLRSRSGPLTVTFKSRLQKDLFSGTIKVAEEQSLKQAVLQQSLQKEEVESLKKVKQQQQLNLTFWTIAILLLIGCCYFLFNLSKKAF
jgi:hypothetical protein